MLTCTYRFAFLDFISARHAKFSLGNRKNHFFNGRRLNLEVNYSSQLTILSGANTSCSLLPKKQLSAVVLPGQRRRLRKSTTSTWEGLVWMTNRAKTQLKIWAISVVGNGRLADDLDPVRRWPWLRERMLRLWRVQDRKSLLIRLILLCYMYVFLSLADTFPKKRL